MQLALTNGPGVVMRPVEVDTSLGNGNTYIKTATPKASEGIRKGDFVSLGTAGDVGKIIKATDNGTTIYAIALEDQVDTNPMRIAVLLSNALFWASYTDVTATDTGSFLAPTDSDLGTAVGVVIPSADADKNYFAVTKGAFGGSLNTVAVIIGIADQATETKTGSDYRGQRVLCRVMSGKLIGA